MAQCTGEAAVARLRLELPPAPKPQGVYRPFTWERELGLIHISGHGPLAKSASGRYEYARGKVGDGGLTDEQARQAARQAGLGVLATLRAALGSLDRVGRLVKSLCMVNAHPLFENHIYVANGFAELMCEVFGNHSGIGSRSAVGVSSLPMNIPFEVEATFEVRPDEGIVGSASLSSIHFAASVPRVINALGNATSLGGSLLRPVALKAMSAVAGKYIDLNRLYEEAGDRIAQLCQAPPGYTAHVVTGAAAGLTLAAAACMTNGDPALVRQLPNTSRISRSVVLVDSGGDNRWNQSLLLTGATLRQVDMSVKLRPACASEEEVKRRLTQELSKEDVACIIISDGYNSQSLRINVIAELSKAAGVPLVVDAAARLPPVENLWRIAAAGADCVLFSAGKAIRGPQSGGIMLGRKVLITNARANGAPNEAAIGRPMKTSKETVVGVLASLEEFVAEERARTASGGYQAHQITQIVDVLRAALARLPTNCSLEMHDPGPITDVQPNQHTFVEVHFNFGAEQLSAPARAFIDNACSSAGANADLYGDSVDHGSPLVIVPTNVPTLVAHKLALGSPPIAVNTTSDGLLLNPYCMSLSDACECGERIVQVVHELLRSTPKL